MGGNSKVQGGNHKDARKGLEQQLSTLLTGWKDQLGEKKFRNRIKKAAKLLSKGLPDKKKTPAIKEKAAATTGKKAKTGKKAAATPAS
ncbi:hypothetical protein [Chitinophaga japonensis]|uniref:Uncharacterized protein n=1 Tax=Chitinophaga japonensis TaxID=104662 RepID=A0A562ST96_CHIJA|nr:hypothetical protein [Chitinophaga japonensis]TWI84497.1 hypothetical protein LX66_4867 [Chitinophaga japonensis]